MRMTVPSAGAEGRFTVIAPAVVLHGISCPAAAVTGLSENTFSVTGVTPSLSAPVACACHVAALELVAVGTYPDDGVPVTAMPLIFATVGDGNVPDRSPPAVEEIVAAVPRPRFVRAVPAFARSE